MKFKESPLVKNHKILTGTKRDMRKKVVKSTIPTSDLKKPTTLKRQLGGNIFTTYNSIAPYESPVFEQPVAIVEIKELPVNRLETNRQNVMAKAEEKKEEPVVEEKVSTKPLPTSKEETPVVENKESTPVNIKSKDEFIKTMTPAFENALKAKGLDTKYAKYLVAQSALESNWGKSQSGKFNFGGIKGKGTIRKTREVINGKSIHINDSFRDFKDINDYANYHVSLLNNKRYQAFSGGDFIDRIVKGGYATDPNYKRALSNVYNQIAKAQEGMKIPKLKGAGELRARILRQFNREKAANRNEEQLVGFDWSRYKSNKPKPETTPTQSEQLENGGVIKAQDGIVTQAINKVKSFLPKEEPKEPINVVDVAKEYAPSAVASMLLGNVNPFVSKLLEGKKPSLDYSHKFGSTGNKFEEFASVMTPIFKEALEENGFPTTNLNNLVRQAALESNYGLDPRGERGFNLSGIKHPGDSIAPKYKKSRYKDGFDYIDFDNLKDYANYKVKVLNDRYKALDAKDTNDFIDRLHGNNSGKYNYSADKDSYRRNLNGTLSLNKYLKRGGILKYQNPAQPIARRDATYVAPKMYAPRPYKTKEEEIIEQNRTSEMISIPASKIVEMVNGKLQIINSPAKQISNVRAGYLSGTDPVGEFIVGGIAMSKPLQWLGKGLQYGAARTGSQWARNRVVGKAINNSEIKNPTRAQPNNIESVTSSNVQSNVTGEVYLGMLEKPKKKISIAEKEGLPKQTRNQKYKPSPLAKELDTDLMMINRGVEPYAFGDNEAVWKIGQSRHIEGTTLRPTVHFTTDQPVIPHSAGDWEGVTETLITPMRELTKRNSYPVNITPMDTYFPNYNIFRIPKNESKVFTTNPFSKAKYDRSGVSAEYSKEGFHLWKDIQAKTKELNELYKEGRMYDSRTPRGQKIVQLTKEISDLKTKHGDIHRQWVAKNSPRATLEDYTKLENTTGLPSGVNPENMYTRPDLKGTGIDYYHAPSAHADSWYGRVESPKYSDGLREFIFQIKGYPKTITEADLPVLQRFVQKYIKDNGSAYPSKITFEHPLKDKINKILSGDILYQYKTGGTINKSTI